MFTATATRIQNLCPYHKKVKVIYSGRGQNNNKTGQGQGQGHGQGQGLGQGQGQGQGQNHKLLFIQSCYVHFWFSLWWLLCQVYACQWARILVLFSSLTRVFNFSRRRTTLSFWDSVSKSFNSFLSGAPAK